MVEPKKEKQTIRKEEVGDVSEVLGKPTNPDPVDPTHGGRIGDTVTFDAVNMPEEKKAKPFDRVVGELAQAEILTQYLEQIAKRDPLQIMSHLMREVDLQHIEMPRARQLLAAWFNALPDKQLAKVEGRARMRRLKQIGDAMFEEFHNLTSQV